MSSEPSGARVFMDDKLVGVTPASLNLKRRNANVVLRFEKEGFQAVSRALGELHKAGVLWQDAVGRFCLAGSTFAAKPPQGGKK